MWAGLLWFGLFWVMLAAGTLVAWQAEPASWEEQDLCKRCRHKSRWATIRFLMLWVLVGVWITTNMGLWADAALLREEMGALITQKIERQSLVEWQLIQGQGNQVRQDVLDTLAR